MPLVERFHRLGRERIDPSAKFVRLHLFRLKGLNRSDLT